jgi:hypothetical protein
MQKLNTLLLCILSVQTLTAQWSTTKLPHPRTRMEGALIDNKVYYAGGYSQIDPVFISSDAVVLSESLRCRCDGFGVAVQPSK